MSKEVWSSSVDKEMTKGLTRTEVENLIRELDDAVMEVCQSYGLS